MNKEEYLEAHDIFVKLGDFKDSEDKLVECNKALIDEQYSKLYDKAGKLMAKGNYVDAYEIYKDISGYKDSSRLAEEAYQMIKDD